MSLKDFGEAASKLCKNPLGIMALFQLLIYGIAGYVTSNLASNNSLLLPLVWFLVLFPVCVLAIFAYVVIFHHEKLYAPSDFANDENFLRAFEKGLNKSKKFSELENNTNKIREIIESYPMFVFARLPVSDQWVLKRIYLDGKVGKEHFGMLSEELKNNYGWLELKGDDLILTEKGKKEISSFIEITIARFS